MNKRILIPILFIFNFAFQKEFVKLDVQNKNMRKLDEELSDDIVILHVNDVHCGLNDTVGYDGFVLYRDEMKKKYKNVILVDVGDHIQGGSIGAISSGEAIIKLMNNIEFNVSILGNHEFDYGIEQLQKLGENITNKYVCSNFCYNKNKSRILEPYKIIDTGKKKIGFIGVLTPLTLTKTYLSSVKDNNNERLYDFLSGNDAKDLYDRVQADIDDLKKNKAVDYVILLTHFGMQVEDYTSDGLLSHLENVDAILDGHTHLIYTNSSKDKNGKVIPITQTGTKLESIGKLTIKSNGSIVSEIIKEVPEPTDKEGAIKITRGKTDRWVDSKTNQFINSLWNEYSDELNAFIGKSDFDLIVMNLSSTDSHYASCRYQECSLGNLVSDALKRAAETEVAILNGGGVRNNLPKGNITSSKVIDILPWFSYIVAKQVPGQVILDALEFGVSRLPNSFGGYPQVSGITFDLDPSVNSTVKTDANGAFVNVTGERRVSNVKINGKDLNLNQHYNVSLLEYLGNGGDGYSMFSNYDVYYESVLTDTDSLIYFIKNDLNGTIPEKYKDIEGRVNIKNSSSSSNSENSPTLIGFKDYKFDENSNIIIYLVYIIFPNYPNIEQKNITMKVNIDYKNRLRLLEEEEVTCIYANKIEPNLYAFNCSKSVKGPVSKIRYVENSLKINGESLPDYDELPLSKSDIANLPDYSLYPLHTLKNSEIIDRTTNSFKY
jgi:2',3'-cyclic-nucleotide 2'-phosphodiesterase (5'-nucleotidase family)